ncbi:MAG: hypothetical protein ACRESZ_06430, partial [Methylococcales bacterium]
PLSAPLRGQSPERLAATGRKEPDCQAFKDYRPGYLHIDTAQINRQRDSWYRFVAIDRATRFVYAELHNNKRRQTAAGFLPQTLAQYPFKIEKILTDNGIEFSYHLLVEANQPKDGRIPPFVPIGREPPIEHRTTLVKHPWTNGMVEAMNKKIARPIPSNAFITTAQRRSRSICMPTS